MYLYCSCEENIVNKNSPPDEQSQSSHISNESWYIYLHFIHTVRIYHLGLDIVFISPKRHLRSQV